MRTSVLFTVAVVLVASSAIRAEDPPEGSIGVQIKIHDDKNSIVVVSTINDSPAEKAGFKEGDVLVRINDFKVKDKDVTQDDLIATVKEVVKNKPGTKIKVTVKRDDKEKEIEVTVAKRNDVFPKEKE
jgi:C-terminal processing protease CtpA/Prc